MVTINLYHPDRKICPAEPVEVSFPNEWNDLTENELRFIAKVILNQTKENAIESRPLIIKFILSERTKKIKLPVNFFNLLDPEEIVISLFPLLDFIVNKNDRTVSPSPLSIRKGIGGDAICKPFDEITCGEFEDCEIAAAKFADEKDYKHLAQIAAILFRRSFFGWRREYIRYSWWRDRYITYNSEKRIKHFLTLPPEQLYSIFIWYAGCRSQLSLYFPDVYEKGKKNGVPDPMVFTNTIHAGAGPKNGSRNQIRRMKLYEFLYDCNQEAIKAKELAAEYEKMK